MAAIFRTFGPFDLERDGDELAATALDDFWASEGGNLKLAKAIGVYILAVKASKNATPVPWYVGKTDKGFQQRLSEHGATYRKILTGSTTGTLQLFLIARQSPSGTAHRKPAKNALGTIDKLETLLIGSCLNKNKDLRNDKKKKLWEMRVPGFLGDTQDNMTADAKGLSQMLKSK
jgi:hypothetical protein